MKAPEPSQFRMVLRAPKQGWLRNRPRTSANASPSQPQSAVPEDEMKKVVTFTAALLAFGASMAFAAGGLNLHFDGCAADGGACRRCSRAT